MFPRQARGRDGRLTGKPHGASAAAGCTFVRAAPFRHQAATRSCREASSHGGARNPAGRKGAGTRQPPISVDSLVQQTFLFLEPANLFGTTIDTRLLQAVARGPFRPHGRKGRALAALPHSLLLRDRRPGARRAAYRIEAPQAVQLRPLCLLDLPGDARLPSKSPATLASSWRFIVAKTSSTILTSAVRTRPGASKRRTVSSSGSQPGARGLGSFAMSAPVPPLQGGRPPSGRRRGACAAPRVRQRRVREGTRRCPGPCPGASPRSISSASCAPVPAVRSR